MLLVFCFKWVLEPNLYMDSVYLTAVAMGPQDKVMLSFLKEALVISMGRKTVAEKTGLSSKN